MIAVVPVRDGLPAAGAAEAVSEAGGRALLIGSDVADAVAELPAEAPEIALAEVGDYRPAAWSGRAGAVVLSAEDTIILPASADGRDLAPALAVRMRRPLAAGALARDRRALGRAAGRRPGPGRPDRPTEPMVATIEPGPGASLAGPPADASLREVKLALPEVTDAEVVEILPGRPGHHRPGGGQARRGRRYRPRRQAHFDDAGARGGADSGASVGATRPVVDAGWTEFARQIGTTGALIDPDLYIAVADLRCGAAHLGPGPPRPHHLHQHRRRAAR